MSRTDLVQVEEAIRIAMSFARVIERTEHVPLAHSIDRSLRHDLHARLDMPPFDQSAMDGWALSGPVRSEGYAIGPTGGGRPGQVSGMMTPGQASRISTGARVPAGADRVVLQEHANRQQDRIVLEKPIEEGANIRLRGEDVRQGDLLLSKGTKLNARRVALLASQGIAAIDVQARPRVAVVSSGSELRQPGESLGESNIYDCNRPMLMAMAARSGAQVLDGGCCVEDAEQLAGLVSNLSMDADLVVLSGGSSIGEGDVTSAGLTLAGATVRELKTAMKPGKPAVVGRLGATSLLALPGNPLAAFVSWFVLGRSMMSTMHGSASGVLEGRGLRAWNELRRPTGRTEFVPARLVLAEGEEYVEFLGGGSGRLLPLSLADGLACIDAVRGAVLAGEPVTFLRF